MCVGVGVGKCFGLDQDWTCTNLIHIGKKMYTGNRSLQELSFTISGVYKSEVLKFLRYSFGYNFMFTKCVTILITMGRQNKLKRSFLSKNKWSNKIRR